MQFITGHIDKEKEKSKLLIWNCIVYFETSINNIALSQSHLYAKYPVISE